MGRVGTDDRPLRVAIVGAGPSGFYAAGALLDQSDIAVSIDFLERLPTPFGLVRDGVAPDHQKIKAVTRIYDKILADPRVRFFGNVSFGTDVLHGDLRRYYDQIVYAVGTPSDRQLGIEGEELEGSYPATAFVGWYNGHPDYADYDFDLSVESVAVIGNGNVAMDVTRILAKPVDALAKTDIADHALARLRDSRIKRIYVLGRRGPVQASFTNPEFRELGDIEGVDVIVSPEELELDPASQAALEESREAQRNLETLRRFAEERKPEAEREIYMRFLISPVEILGDNGRVAAIRLQHNKLEPTASGYLRAVGQDCYDTLPVALVFRAIGYMGVQLPGVPYDHRKGTIPNRTGRVINPDTQEIIPREYVVGWAKRGPTGVIGTNKADAVETVTQMLQDVDTLEPIDDKHADPRVVESFIYQRQPRAVSYQDWLVLNSLETERGRASRRPRIKYTRVADMLDAIENMKRDA